MKKFLPYVIICLLIFLLAIIWRSLKDGESVESDTKVEEVIEADAVVSQPAAPEAASVVGEPIPGSPEFWRKGYKTPMDFYGLVLDQKDLPVSSATIRISWNESDGDNEVVTMTSDGEGRFSFLGRRGLSLRVDVKKEGYYQIFTDGGSKQNLDFYVPGGEPDNDGNSNNPAIFRLQKKGTGVDLVNSEFRSKLPKNGEVKIDLLTGRALSGGQLELSLKREGEERPYGWSAEVQIKEGGFVKADGQFMHEAPRSGYVERLNWSFPLEENGRPETYVIKEDYYVKFGSPAKYGRIMIYLKSHTWHLLLESSINPDGGRNLEPK